MANKLYSGVMLARFSGSFCYYPSNVSGGNSKPASVSTLFRFVSNVDADPGDYEFLLTHNGLTQVVSMQAGVGGIIESVYVAPGIPPSVGAGVASGLGTYEATITRVGVNYYADVSMDTAPDCGGGWTEATITSDVIISPVEVPVARFAGASNGGGCVIQPGQYTVDGYKAKDSYQADWVGGGVDPPGPTDGVVTFSFFPAVGGVPSIPDEDRTIVPIDVINGSGVPVRFCLGERCIDIGPGDTEPFEWPTYDGDPDTPIVTYPECPLCEPYFPPPPDWDPYDPGDPTNCVPAPGIICPVFQIYIPPPSTNPDPEPEPEPEPGDGTGNDGNYQGCIKVPCALPYIYTYESR